MFKTQAEWQAFFDTKFPCGCTVSMGHSTRRYELGGWGVLPFLCPRPIVTDVEPDGSFWLLMRGVDANPLADLDVKEVLVDDIQDVQFVRGNPHVAIDLETRLGQPIRLTDTIRGEAPGVDALIALWGDFPIYDPELVNNQPALDAAISKWWKTPKAKAYLESNGLPSEMPS